MVKVKVAADKKKMAAELSAERSSKRIKVTVSKGKKGKPKDYGKMGVAEWEEERMKKDPYLQPREKLKDGRWWNKEQEAIYHTVIESKSTEVVIQKYVDFEQLKEYDYQFGGIIALCKNMGLTKIMSMEQPYSIDAVKQFYASVIFVDDPEKTLKFMSGEDQLTTPFMDFVRAMGHEAQYGKAAECFGHGNPPGKGCLKWHYPEGTKQKDIGNISKLKTRYYYLMKLLNATICAKGGNLGEISGHTIQLLCHARDDDREVDVMQWMYETMKQVVKLRRSLCYAPYIYCFISYVRAARYPHLPGIKLVHPPNMTHHPYQPMQKRAAKNNTPHVEIGESSKGGSASSSASASAVHEFFTKMFSMCKATHERTYKLHKLQKKHLREFRQDRRDRGFNKVHRDGVDLDESDKEDFPMPPVTVQDFKGWVGVPHMVPPGHEGEGDDAAESDSSHE